MNGLHQNIKRICLTDSGVILEGTRPMVRFLWGRGVILTLCLSAVMVAGIANAETRNAAIGEIIPLSGTAVGKDFVYLFMTGPGVPSAGSRMDSSISPVISGYPNTFTQVQVSDDQWSYRWNTGRVSGGLAAGEYTIYAATQPVAADSLSGVPYTSLEINLYRPVTTGNITIRSFPTDGQVSVNGKYSGNTPLTLNSLSPGTYRIEVVLQGYFPANETVNLTAGDQNVVDLILQPVTPETTGTSIPVTTTPVPLPSPSPTPTRAALFLPSALIALLAGLCMTLRR
jgi:hypothetical protein